MNRTHTKAGGRSGQADRLVASMQRPTGRLQLLVNEVIEKSSFAAVHLVRFWHFSVVSDARPLQPLSGDQPTYLGPRTVYVGLPG
jgi:hypothetical protein